MAEKKLNESEVLDLLEDIQTWMIENDYECGDQGSEIYNRISKLIDEEED